MVVPIVFRYSTTIRTYTSIYVYDYCYLKNIYIYCERCVYNSGGIFYAVQVYVWHVRLM